MTDCPNCAALRQRIAAIEAALKVKALTLQRVYAQYAQIAAAKVAPAKRQDEYDDHWLDET